MKFEREKILNSLSINLRLSREKIIVLEAVSFALSEIENKVSLTSEEQCIYKSKYAFEYEGCNIINMFIDDCDTTYVDPIFYYGIDTIRDSQLIKLMNKMFKKELPNNEVPNFYQLKKIAARMIGYIQLESYGKYVEGLYYYVDERGNKIIDPFVLRICDVDRYENSPIRLMSNTNPQDKESLVDIDPTGYKPYQESPFNDIIEKHFCNTFNDYYDKDFKHTILSKQDKKNLINFALNKSEKDYTSMYLNTYLQDYTYSFESEKLRTLMLDFFAWYDNGFYSDKERINKEWHKISLKHCFYLLFINLYNTVYSIDDDMLFDKLPEGEELFKKEIIKDFGIRVLFFKSIETLLKYPSEEGFKKVKEGLKNAKSIYN